MSEKPIDLEFEPVQVRRYHVQVRVSEKGAKKGDGRWGRLLIEDDNAPYEVVRWFQSNKCQKINKGSGKSAIIYINDDMLPTGIDTSGEDEKEPVPSIPANIPPMEFTAAIQFAHRLDLQLAQLETELRIAKENHYNELAILREARQKEITDCDEQIKAARERVKTELAREQEEFEQLSDRRRMMSEERSAMAIDLSKDQETFNDTRRNMVKYNSAGTVETIVEGVTKIATGISGTPLEGLVAAYTQILLKKASN